MVDTLVATPDPEDEDFFDQFEDDFDAENIEEIVTLQLLVSEQRTIIKMQRLLINLLLGNEL